MKSSIHITNGGKTIRATGNAANELFKAMTASVEVKQEKIHRPIVAVGRKAPDGTIEVTDVLCSNFPDMTNKEMEALSMKLYQWGNQPTP